MAGCSNFTSAKNLKFQSILFFHFKYHSLTIAFRVVKNKNTKTWKERKEGRFWKQARYSPIPKKRDKSERAQAQMPLLKNTLLVSQIA